MPTPTTPPRIARTLERAFAATAALSMLAAAAAAWLVRGGYGAAPVFAAGCAAVLLCACVGLWAADAVARAQRGEIARIYAAALNGKRDHPLGARSEPLTAMERLQLAVANFFEATRMVLLYGNVPARFTTDIRRAIAVRLGEAQEIAASLQSDAHAIATAAQGSREVERDLSDRLASVCDKTERAADATETVADEAAGLADAIRAVTAETARAATIAARLAETAFATQRGVGSMSATTAAMTAAAGEVRDALQQAEMLSLRLGIEKPGDERVADEIRRMASACGTALEQMLATVRELQQHSVQLAQRSRDMSEVVQAQQEFSHALSHASLLQADAVGRMLQKLGKAQSALGGLRDQAQQVALPPLRLGTTLAAQHAVERLPGYADAMAQILRGLPDFSPGEKAREKI